MKSNQFGVKLFHLKSEKLMQQLSVIDYCKWVIDYPTILDLVNKGKLEVVHSKTEWQIADAFTKALKVERFEELRKMMDVTSLKYLT
ncbi:hypothetical protein Lal_00026788 [Lupinus albus]|nr:hypothetical protein Lal_00026788 [Lupinus albus]